jgi:hypothetical protein
LVGLQSDHQRGHQSQVQCGIYTTDVEQKGRQDLLRLFWQRRFADPLERDPQLVLMDLMDEWLTGGTSSSKWLSTKKELQPHITVFRPPGR